MFVVMRFRVPETAVVAFEAVATQALTLFASASGNEGCEFGRNLDDPGLWVIWTRWRDVGSYRRSLGGYDAKLTLTPLMAYALDEPSAYDAPEDVGSNVPRSR